MDRSPQIPSILIVTSTGIPLEWASSLADEFSGLADFRLTKNDVESIKGQLPGIDALIGCPRHVFNDEIFRLAGDKLKWIHIPGAGCEEFFIQPLVESSVILTNGKIIQGPEVADHAVALVLALSRKLHWAIQGKSDLDKRPIELKDKIALVIGCGGIGLLVGERLSAFGMEVYGIDAEILPMTRSFRAIRRPDYLNQFLKMADVVVMAAPVTKLTTKMMGREQFELMKEGSIFVNCSRGKTVDYHALAETASSEKFYGIGLDVTDPEPLPKDHPLLSLGNVIVTPHIAGLSDQNRERSRELIRENIERFLTGSPLLNVVDKLKQY